MDKFNGWFERHKVLSKLLGVVVVMGVFYGAKFALASWLVSQAHPNTPIAHIYCGVLANDPGGSPNPTDARKEFELSKTLAFQQGGAAGVEKARAQGESIIGEWASHRQKGDLDDLRQHYQDKCLGY